MAVIKLNASGQIILRGGLPSCTCCCSCDYTIEVFAGLDNNYFSFDVTNNCPSSTLTVTAFNGLGTVYSLPEVVIGGEGPITFYVEDAQLEMSEEFTITIEECGESPVIATPPAV